MSVHQVLKTKLINYTTFVDLIAENGKLVTYLMTKHSEPNNFIVARQADGDQVDTFMKEYKE